MEDPTMKKRKLLAITIALVMIMSMMMAIPASANLSNGSIVINTAQNTALTGTFSAYKILDIVGWTPDPAQPTNQAEGQFVYRMDSRFAAFRPSAQSAQDIWQYLTAASANNLSFNSAAMVTLSKELHDFIHVTPGGIAAAGSATATLDATSVTIPNLTPGYYLVTGKSVINGEEVTTLSILTNAFNSPTSVNMKADAPTITKQVHNTNTPLANGDGWTDWADVNIGDEVDFRFTSVVPNMQGYTQYTFTVRDTMSAGLTFNPGSVAVTIGGNNISTSANTWTLNQSPGSGRSFDIVFDAQNFINYTVGAPILITYSAILNDQAIIGNPGNPNKVDLVFSNDPHTTGTGTTPESEVIVYTYEMGIYKYTGQTPRISLADAVFELRRDSATGTVVTFAETTIVPDANTTGANVYTVGGSVATFVTPRSGLVDLKGLDAGTYYLIELAPPEGYNPPDGPIEVVIARADNERGFTVNGNQYQPNQVDFANGRINVLNQAGGLFPGVGGVGRTIFFIGGGVLMVGALIALLVIPKKKENNEIQ